mmetsp:Transcript_6721/g.14052  ORF Transcript_6721/g.14052 Transcript_6721/m.14052 type:complete len:202 (+) Transcript_6721:178-783(+)
MCFFRNHSQVQLLNQLSNGLVTNFMERWIEPLKLTTSQWSGTGLREPKRSELIWKVFLMKDWKQLTTTLSLLGTGTEQKQDNAGFVTPTNTCFARYAHFGPSLMIWSFKRLLVIQTITQTTQSRKKNHSIPGGPTRYPAVETLPRMGTPPKSPWLMGSGRFRSTIKKTVFIRRRTPCIRSFSICGDGDGCELQTTNCAFTQ